MPRLTTESWGSGNTTWLGSSHGIENARTATMDVSTFTLATHYPNGYFPSGLPVNATVEGAITPWTGATGQNLGFVLFDTPVVTVIGVIPDNVPAAILRHGIIITSKLPLTLTVGTGTTAGFTFATGS